MKKEEHSQDSLPNAGCPGQIQLPTPREKECLDRMRALKQEVREIKKRLRFLRSSGTEDDAGKTAALENDMERLKADWDKWEQWWQEAVRERMIYLGHEDG